MKLPFVAEAEAQPMAAQIENSRNRITIEQLHLACKHVKELIGAGVTENLAIRTLELFSDVYAKLHTGGSATPHHVSQVKLWSVAALKLREAVNNFSPRDYVRVEHGTPRRAFARMVMDLYETGKLNAESMNKLVEAYWKLAVITLDEDRRLNKLARSKAFACPSERWAAAEVDFPTDSGLTLTGGRDAAKAHELSAPTAPSAIPSAR